jgi:ABC-type Fe3+-siderophore transport system permease subunit
MNPIRPKAVHTPLHHIGYALWLATIVSTLFAFLVMILAWPQHEGYSPLFWIPCLFIVAAVATSWIADARRTREQQCEVKQ